jgi:predicted dehydrogenase
MANVITRSLTQKNPDDPLDPAHRLFSPALAGGALLDLGVYLVSLSSLVIGSPTRVTAVGPFTSTEVDAQVCAILQNARGALSTLFTTLSAPMPTGAFIVGTSVPLLLTVPSMYLEVSSSPRQIALWSGPESLTFAHPQEALL